MSEVKFDQKLLNPTPREEKKAREKLIHITKRIDAPLWFKAAVRAVSVLTALLVCALILNIFSPGNFGDFFSESFNALGGSKNKFLNTLYEFTLLLGISIAILPAFKMKFWNLGGEGQVLAGALVAALVSKFIGPSVNDFVCTLLMIIGAMLGGALWAFIPAFFKAKFDTNETLFTLMMNYVAMGFIVFFAFIVNPDHGNFSDLTHGTFNFTGDSTSLFTLIPFIIVILMTGFMYVYTNYTKHGYELTVVGETRNTAKYVGIDVPKVIIRTVILCGLLCGIIGYFTVAKQKSVSETILNGRGFTAVMIAWLGHMNVIEIIIMAFLVAFITRGSGQVATQLDLNTSFTKISIAVFLITILAFKFFLNYEIHINKNFFKKNKEKEVNE